MSIPEPDTLNTLVARIFRIDDVTLGEPARGLIARYRGRLLSDDSASAYDQLADSVRSYGITPLFRLDHGQQVIYLVPKKPAPRPARPAVNVILFILTVVSVLMAGEPLQGPVPSSLLAEIVQLLKGI